MHPANEHYLRGSATGDLELCQLAISQGCDVNARTVEGDNALHLACAFGHPDLVPELIQFGTNTNDLNHDGLTPAHEAVINARPRSLMALMVYGQDVNWDIQDPQGRTVQQVAEETLTTIQNLQKCQEYEAQL